MIDPASRYRTVDTLIYLTGQGQAVRYLARRFPAPPSVAGAVETVIGDRDRPDLMAARAWNDPLAFWRVAELNGVLDPFDLVDCSGRIVRLPRSGTAF